MGAGAPVDNNDGHRPPLPGQKKVLTVSYKQKNRDDDLDKLFRCQKSAQCADRALKVFELHHPRKRKKK